MRVSLSWLRDFVDLPEEISASDIAKQLTLIGFEVEGISPFSYTGDVEDDEEKVNSDTVLDISVTPNRPDALSHMGIARELAAGLKLRPRFVTPSCREQGGVIHDSAHVTLTAKNECLRYACRVIDGIKVGASPAWIKARLEACGVRPINNVVDISNLVMLERGQPLHAFDMDTIAKERGKASICIRAAKEGEVLTTLDGIERKLLVDDLVIADAKGPLALAGVMGGQDSEVTDKTSVVLLESAYFDPGTVRRVARRHGISSEASYRFERGCDPNGVVAALDRACELLAKYAGGRVSREVIDNYPKHVEPAEISLRMTKLAEISGLAFSDLEEDKIRNLFLALGIETIGKRGDALSFRVPTSRPDLTREIDLIEEAMRLIGLDKVPSRISFVKSGKHDFCDEKNLQVSRLVRQALTASGFYESVNYAFGSPNKYREFLLKSHKPFIELQNPFGEEMSVMRQSLLPGLLENAVTNTRRFLPSVKLFEIGGVFLGVNQAGKMPSKARMDNKREDYWAHEATRLAGLMTGELGEKTFDRSTSVADFYDLKGALQEVFSKLHLSTLIGQEQVEFKRSQDYLFLHPGCSAQIIWKSLGHVIGCVGELHPDLRHAYEFKHPVYVFECDLDFLTQIFHEHIKVELLPKFPAVQRDLALLLEEEISARQVVQVITAQEKVKALLEKMQIFDIYRGKGIEPGKKSMALSLTMRAKERTLTDDEVNEMMDDIFHALKKEIGATVR